MVAAVEAPPCIPPQASGKMSKVARTRTRRRMSTRVAADRVPAKWRFWPSSEEQPAQNECGRDERADREEDRGQERRRVDEAHRVRVELHQRMIRKAIACVQPADTSLRASWMSAADFASAAASDRGKPSSANWSRRHR